MTDDELLDLAAKAVNKGAWHPLTHDTPNGKWNPLEDDGDALRLALVLGLSFEPYPIYNTEKHSVIVKQRRRSDQLRESNPTECIERYQGDPMGATRRAIVRAAAEIGRAMP